GEEAIFEVAVGDVGEFVDLARVAVGAPDELDAGARAGAGRVHAAVEREAGDVAAREAVEEEHVGAVLDVVDAAFRTIAGPLEGGVRWRGADEAHAGVAAAHDDGRAQRIGAGGDVEDVVRAVDAIDRVLEESGNVGAAGEAGN